MNIVKRGLLGLGVLGIAGAGVVGGLAASASAQPVNVIHATSVLVARSVPVPGITSLSYNNYQPSVLAPGFKLVSTTQEQCLTVSPIRTVCNFRTAEVGPGLQPTLAGNAVMTPFGQSGTITSGTGAWHGARGVFTDASIAPNVANSTLVFSTP